MTKPTKWVGWLCWGLTSQSTIFQSCGDGAIASWVINQYFQGVKCLAQGHNTAEVGLEPWTSSSGVRHSTTEPPRSPTKWVCAQRKLRSAWASAQADLSLHCQISLGILGMPSLIVFAGCTLILLVLSRHGSNVRNSTFALGIDCWITPTFNWFSSCNRPINQYFDQSHQQYCVMGKLIWVFSLHVNL